ncbi:twin transmembrane helix small protein [Panacagrimonas sp.]|uniref:twin transmembrane helix small protein n=1 Tax=Panacagrimonas sp. TaxID=2480088 RepID=UPI003B5259DC
MLIKFVILALLAAIIAALIFGGVYLVKDPSTSRRTARALSWRVGLQVLLILVLVLAFFMGWLQPHGVGG